MVVVVIRRHRFYVVSLLSVGLVHRQHDFRQMLEILDWNIACYFLCKNVFLVLAAHIDYVTVLIPLRWSRDSPSIINIGRMCLVIDGEIDNEEVPMTTKFILQLFKI